MKLFSFAALLAGSAHAAGDLYQMFSSCLESDIENNLWPATAPYQDNYQLQCEVPPLLDGQSTEDDRTIFHKCVVTCKTGYVMTSDVRTDVIRSGTYTCKRIHDNWQYYYWRYNDGTTPNTDSNFAGCVASNCFTPVLLPRKGPTTRKPNQIRAWGWKWTTGVADDGAGKTGAAAGTQQSGKLYIYKAGVKTLMPTADFATNGWTVIIKLKEEMKGRFFTTKGANLNAHRDGTANADWGLTFSFSSRSYNMDMTYDDATWQSMVTAAKAAKTADTSWVGGTEPAYESYMLPEELPPFRLSLPISFYSDPGETLPNIQNIAQVSIVEGEYAHTECTTDSSTYTSYGSYAPGTTDLQDLDSNAMTRVGDYLFNPVGYNDDNDAC